MLQQKLVPDKNAALAISAQKQLTRANKQHEETNKSNYPQKSSFWMFLQGNKQSSSQCTNINNAGKIDELKKKQLKECLELGDQKTNSKKQG